MTGLPSSIQEIIERAEARIGDLQDELTMAATNLATTVGPLAAAHRLAELALEFEDLAAKRERAAS